MSRLRVNSFSVSLDVYGAGPGQSLEQPLGRGGEQLHQWVFPTRTFQRMFLFVGCGKSKTQPIWKSR